MMRYRRFGKTELQIPVISCGGMRYQQSWKDADPVTEASQQNLEATIRRSLELGINHIETARGYGTSEYQLGKILPTLDRDKLIVQTKVAPTDTPKEFLDTFNHSMDLLKLDHVDLLGFHGVNSEDEYQKTLVCLDAALDLKKQGRIRHLGFSTHGACDIIVKTIEIGVLEYVNLHWYFINQDNWPAVEAATRRDMGVFIISPNDKGGMLYKPSPRLVELCKPLDPMVFNSLFCLLRPEVHTLSCGAARPSDFDPQLEAVRLLDQAAELVAPIEARLNAALEEAVGKDFARTWQQGLPDWEHAPNQINVPVILRMYNLVKAFDMVDYAKMRYNMFGVSGTWFPGSRIDTLDGLDYTEYLKNSPHKARIPEAVAETHALLKGEQRKRLSQSA
jgi:predicted aldo/keto reductase-like oxidoreductase